MTEDILQIPELPMKDWPNDMDVGYLTGWMRRYAAERQQRKAVVISDERRAAFYLYLRARLIISRYATDNILHRLPPVGFHPHHPWLHRRGSLPGRAAGAAVPHETLGEAFQRDDDTLNRKEINH